MHCSQALTNTNGRGDTVIRTRAIVLRPDGVILVCPKCKNDVTLDNDLASILVDKLTIRLGR